MYSPVRPVLFRAVPPGRTALEAWMWQTRRSSPSRRMQKVARWFSERIRPLFGSVERRYSARMQQKRSVTGWKKYFSLSMRRGTGLVCMRRSRSRRVSLERPGRYSRELTPIHVKELRSAARRRPSEVISSRYQPRMMFRTSSFAFRQKTRRSMVIFLSCPGRPQR